MPLFKYQLYLIGGLLLFMLPATIVAAEQEVIIGFHQKIGSPELELVDNIGGVVRQAYDLIPAIAATVPEYALPALNNHPLVAYVEENTEVTTIEPSDVSEFFYTPRLSAASLAEYQRSWGLQRIHSEDAHKQGITGKGIKIAVIDSGVDFHHEELDDNYRGGYNFIDGNNSPLDDSYNSHGTNVAGIIAAEKNGIGVIGVAPDASVYALKVLNDQGAGFTAAVIAALQWSVRHDMDIANISIQGMHSEALQAACDAAYEAGLLIIAAAGNSYGNAASYPASYSSVIAVTGTDANDWFGYFAPIDTEIELSAPGVLIPSTARNGRYGVLSGTSQAAPHVAGVAALMMSKTPEYPIINGLRKNESIRMKLQMSILDLGQPGRDELYGYGLVDGALPAVNIDKVTCDGDRFTVTGTSFGRYLDSTSTTMTVYDTNTTKQCNISTWTTSMIVADCGSDPPGSVKVTGVFGSATNVCTSSEEYSGRPLWWLIARWWSDWSWSQR